MNQKSIIAILGVVVVILIGTTVYFATINKATQPVVPAPKVVQQPAQAPAPSVQPTPVTAQPTNETANWQTYSNTKYGFEFQHPKSITFVSEKEEKFGENMRVSLMVNGGREWQNRQFPLLAVHVWTKDEYSKLLKNPDSYSSSQLKAGVSRAIEKDNKVYELAVGFQDGPTQWTSFVQTEDYKKLLSSFKFTK